MSSDRSKITIVTHNGTFHSDDIFAVATLLIFLGDLTEVEIIRTRDKSVINPADYVVDVGGEYDPERNKFDHHQGGVIPRLNGIPYASFGLVWKKYGEIVCGNREIADKIEQFLVLPVDARDNGVDIMTPIYPEITPFELRNIVFAFRTTWKEDKKELYASFLELVNLAKKIIQREIIHMRDEAEGKKLVMNLYSKTQDKRILILDDHYPFDTLGKDMPEVLLVVFPDISDGNWCLECIRNDFNSYVSRMLLPKEWAGKNGEELEKVTGVQGSIFCHKSSFFAVAKTREAILALANLTLNS